jgi:DNA-binding LacI/PurR family transcriptional regulator
MDRAIQGVDSDTVLVNNADSVYEAVSRLVRQGHRRIAIVTGLKSVYSAKERLVGYLRALSDNGILYDDDSQIVVLSGAKSYAVEPEAKVTVYQINDMQNPRWLIGNLKRCLASAEI